MKESSRLLISLLSHLGHALKNIETVFGEATEELTTSASESHLIIGKDTEIALNKLSKISNLLGSLEDGGTEDAYSILVALQNLLLLSCPDEQFSTLLEVQTSGSKRLEVVLPCGERLIRELLHSGETSVDLPMPNILLTRLLVSILKEQQSIFFLNNKKLI